MATSKTSDKGRPLEELRERDALTHALLSATAQLAQGQDAQAILRGVCDALVAASPHIRLAWMYLGDPNAAIVRPEYIVGPASAYAEHLALDLKSLDTAGPTRRAMVMGRPVVAPVRTDPGFAPWREQALKEGLEESASFPFGATGHAAKGVVAIYADEPDYFERVGIEPFIAFTQLAEVALEQAALRQRLQDLATFDHLTGLLNRRAMREILEREHGRAQRRGRPYTLLLFDLDRFKLVNDNYGHAVGDQVLVALARAARQMLRDGDWIGRWGGEEFLCFLNDVDCDAAIPVAERLRRHLAAQVVHADSHAVRVTVSIGVASYPGAGTTLDAVLNSADAALYEAKRAGRNRVMPAISGKVRILSIAGRLEAALQEGRLRAAYQPIVELGSGKVVAQEALARIVNQDGTLLEAASFIDAASQLHLLHRVDYHIIRQTLERWAGAEAPDAPIYFVNVSGNLLRHSEYLDELQQTLVRQRPRSQGDAPLPFVLEITERDFFSDLAEARRILAPLLDLGLQLALDDFGSGHSSFRYLADLPIAYLKIEGQLVHRAPQEKRVRSILQGIQDMARDLGLITVAERVEDEDELAVLREVGVDWGQGHYFGAPAFD